METESMATVRPSLL